MVIVSDYAYCLIFHYDIYIKIVVSQIENDIVELELSEKENRVAKLSMVAKYAPRANKQCRNIAKAIYRNMYPKDVKAEEKYRKVLAKLNNALSTTEVLMCAKNYSGIEFRRVPSVCLMAKITSLSLAVKRRE